MVPLSHAWTAQLCRDEALFMFPHLLSLPRQFWRQSTAQPLGSATLFASPQRTMVWAESWLGLWRRPLRHKAWEANLVLNSRLLWRGSEAWLTALLAESPPSHGKVWFRYRLLPRSRGSLSIEEVSPFEITLGIRRLLGGQE